VLISAVDPGSPAAQVGLQEGDLVVEVNHKPVTKAGDFQSAVAASRKDGKVLMLVKRKNASLFVLLPLN